ncbi:MAG: hypothetical protein HY608_09710 [Planctomycetes bacterium]|nr:hypothetical protein [Planctomycetota bacterium]
MGIRITCLDGAIGEAERTRARQMAQTLAATEGAPDVRVVLDRQRHEAYVEILVRFPRGQVFLGEGRARTHEAALAAAAGHVESQWSRHRERRLSGRRSARTRES